MGNKNHYKYSWIEISEGEIELTIPDEIHNLLTRAINHYISKFKHQQVQKLLQKIREEMIRGGGIKPLLSLHVPLIYILNVAPEEKDLLKQLAIKLKEIAENDTLKIYLTNAVIQPQIVNLLYTIRYGFLGLKKASHANIYYYNNSHILFEAFANEQGEFTLTLPKGVKYKLYIRYKNYYKLVKDNAKENNNITIKLQKIK